MSTSEWYNQIETSIANLTTQGLLRALNKFNNKEREILSSLFIKKIEKNKNFRPLVFYIGYCLAKGEFISVDSLSAEEKKLISDITASIEAENIATYYINHYIDQKCDIKDKQDEKNRVLAGILSNNIAQAIIENTNLNTEIKLELIRLINLIDMDIAKAQIYEINTGIFKNIDYFENEEEFLRVYFERCRKISGQFYGRSAEMGYIIGSNSIEKGEEKIKIEKFYTEMIALLQFSNDIGDYALPNMHSGTLEKNFYKDFGSDFKNKRLTYPNYLLLKRATNKEDQNIIENILLNGFNDVNTKNFITLMKNYSIFQDCFKLLNYTFNQEKKKLWLPASNLRKLISSSVIIVRSNKLLTTIKKMIS
jgi:geranylgeranyl pyrophosphate synthase